MRRNARTSRWARVTAAVFATVVACPVLGEGSVSDCAAPCMIVLSDDSAPFRAAADELAQRLDARSSIVRLDDFRATCGFQDGSRYVGVGPAAATALALQAPRGIGVAFCMIPSADRAGIDGRPGLVGVSTSVAVADQADLMRRTIPRLQRVGVLYRGNSDASVSTLAELRASGITIVAVDLDAASSVSSAIASLLNQDPDVIWTFPDPAVYDSASLRALLMASIKARVPVFGFSAGVVRAGALLGIDIDPVAQAGQLAEMLNAGSGGEAQAELRPVLNLIVADQLDIRVPSDVRSDATQVFD